MYFFLTQVLKMDKLIFQLFIIINLQSGRNVLAKSGERMKHKIQ